MWVLPLLCFKLLLFLTWDFENEDDWSYTCTIELSVGNIFTLILFIIHTFCFDSMPFPQRNFSFFCLSELLLGSTLLRRISCAASPMPLPRALTRRPPCLWRLGFRKMWKIWKEMYSILVLYFCLEQHSFLLSKESTCQVTLETYGNLTD